MNRQYTQANEGDCHTPQPNHKTFGGVRNDSALKLSRVTFRGSEPICKVSVQQQSNMAAKKNFA